MIRASTRRRSSDESLTERTTSGGATEMTSHADLVSEATDELLRSFLRAQRESVLAIVEGLSEEA